MAVKKELGNGFRRELWRDKAGASSIPDLLGGGAREEEDGELLQARTGFAELLLPREEL